MNIKEAFKVVKEEIGDPYNKCYIASEAVYHLAGGKEAGIKPVVCRLDNTTHWWLICDGVIYDVTAEQFDFEVPYEKGIAKGFLTKRPSKRAQAIISSIERG